MRRVKAGVVYGLVRVACEGAVARAAGYDVVAARLAARNAIRSRPGGRRVRGRACVEVSAVP